MGDEQEFTGCYTIFRGVSASRRLSAVAERMEYTTAMRAGAHHIHTEAWYLDWERDQPSRHEYWQGEVFAMAGGTPRHNALAMRVGAMLDVRLRGGPCRTFSPDQRFRTPSGLMTYADASVICGKIELASGTSDTAINPTVLVEVLSPSTREYDRGAKLAMYKEIPTLRDIVLVDPDSVQIDHHFRTHQDWETRVYRGLDAVVRLAGIPVQLPLFDVYDGAPDPT